LLAQSAAKQITTDIDVYAEIILYIEMTSFGIRTSTYITYKEQ